MNTDQKVVILEWLAANSGVTAMDGARVVHTDWHKVSDYLEELVRKGIAKYTLGNIDGLHKYALNK